MLQQLIEISQFYGNDKSYVIAGGGNTSFKTSDTIYVKASGTNLSCIDEHGFVALNRKKLSIISTRQYSANAAEREEQVKTDLMNSRLFPEKGQRPSVETSMHEIINYVFVVHTHPTLANSVLCSLKAKETIDKLFGNEVVFIEYTDPGYILFIKVKAEIEKFRLAHNGTDPQIIFLENHGLFVSANSIDEVKTIYADIEKKIAGLITEKVRIYDISSSLLAPDIAMALARLTGKKVAFRNNSVIEKYSQSQQSFLDVSMPFTPDNIVYCKAFPLFVEMPDKTDELNDVLAPKIAHFNLLHGYNPKIVVVQNTGVFALEESLTQAETILDVFQDLILVSAGTQYFGGPKFMNEREIAFIDNWEVENYRRNQSKTVK